MSLTRNLALLAAALSFGSLSQAQTTPPEVPAEPFAPPAASTGLSEADQAKIVEKVTQMRKDFDRQKREVVANALARFESAASGEGSAVAFYFDCQRVVQERTPDLDPSNDKDDAKAAQDRAKQQMDAFLAAPGRASALRVQLLYLALTLHAPEMKDKGALVARVRDLATQAVGVVKASAAVPVQTPKKPASTVNSKGKSKPAPPQSSKEEERARRQISQTMTQGAMGSVFAQAYNLRSYFKAIDGWSDSPLDLAGIYEGFVLPWYRENKRGDLNSVWDEYLANEIGVHRSEQEDREYARWGVGEYKGLLWKKWFDLLQHGTNHLMALDELSKLVKENPTHPSVGNWVSQLATIADGISGAAPAPAPEPEK